jgi:Ricin-type beta-trefoil lectin domain-like/Glycosyl transferase family 2
MVLEVAGESCEDKAGVFLRGDNGGAHQRWRLVPVGEGGHEYAIMNVHSGKALDLWDGAWRDDAEIVQLGYWHGTQQRWVLTACDAATTSRAVMTIVRNESVFLPIWLRYYRQFFSAQDMYVLDHQSTDGSTEGHGFVRVPVSHPEYGAGWQRDIVQRSQHELIGRYDVVLCTDVDEIVAPDPRLGDLGTYIDRFDEDFITCQGYEILHRKDLEPPFDPTRNVLRQRFTWYANPLYSKPLLARVPMLWNGGCHERIDGRTNNDPHLYLIHLHRMDYDICLTRHHDRVRFPLAQIDRDRRWGYQNQITDPTTFSSWFFHDSCGPSPLCPQPIPPWWRDLV